MHSKTILFLIWTLGFPILLSANLIQNGSFEYAATTGTEVAQHWGKIDAANRVSCSSGCADNFDYMASLGIDPTIANRPVIYTPLNIAAGVQLDLSFSFKAQPAGVQYTQIRVYLVKDPNAGAPLTDNNINNYVHQAVYATATVTSTSWQQATVSFTPSGSFEYLWIDLNFTIGSADNIIDIDNVRLTNPAFKDDLCIASFAPLEEVSYVVSGWAREAAPLGKVTYTDPAIEIVFSDANDVLIGTAGPFYPSGKIIDEWQRIEAVFSVPANTGFLALRIRNFNTQAEDVFFDDIRIFPVNGELTSYVYDPVDLRLVAQLDNNNYATFYEYDEEGKPIRLKRETERGVITVNETRDNTYNPTP